MNEEPRKKKESGQAQQIYVPATVGAPAGSFLHVIRFPIALLETPDQVCGTAQRVGYVQTAGNKQAIYRLKLRRGFASRKTATLPVFFLLVNGTFVPYEHTNVEDEKQ